MSIKILITQRTVIVTDAKTLGVPEKLIRLIKKTTEESKAIQLITLIAGADDIAVM